MAIAAGGFVQSHTTTARSVDIQPAVRALQTVPADIGAWEGSDFDFPADQLRVAEITGCLARRYINRLDGNEITLLVFCGLPGPVSLHAPTVCFPSAGLNLEGEPIRCTVSAGGISAELWSGDFVKLDGGVPVRLRTCWSWYGNQAFQIPANPRMTFARSPYLCKIYVTQAIEGNRPIAADDPCRAFIQAALPDLSRALNPQVLE
jgi:Protein of unknown function (DUF3485)